MRILVARWSGRLRRVSRQRGAWIAMALAALLLDYAWGPDVYLAPLFLLPITLAAWHGRLRLAVAFALGLLYAAEVWEPPGGAMPAAVNAGVRMLVLALVAILIRRARNARDLERELTTLRGLLPICLYCKRIEDERGRWVTVEEYVGARSVAAFTHRVCPLCTGTHARVFFGSPAVEGEGGAPGPRRSHSAESRG